MRQCATAALHCERQPSVPRADGSHEQCNASAANAMPIPSASILTAPSCTWTHNCRLSDSLTERIVAQASPSKPVDAARSYEADLVCYGIGRFSNSLSARLQLATLLALRLSLSIAPTCTLQLYDPLLSSLELAALCALGVEVLERNEEAKRRVSRCTVFYMPHCGQALYNNLLWANWGWAMRDEETGSQKLRAAPSTSSEERKQESEEQTVDDELSSQLSSVHVSSARSSAHLGHVILVGNQLSTYTDKRSFPSTDSAPLTAYTRRRPVHTQSNLSNRCPFHSRLLAPPAAVSAAGCEHECVCLVDALGLLQCRSLESELGGSSAEMRLAFHDTAVQWFELARVGGGERERAEQWLQHRVAEPRRLADDGELVLSAAKTVVLEDT